MPCDGAIIFSDLMGKLDVLRVECAKCERAGRYRLADLITRYGRDESSLPCTRKQARSDSDPCAAIWPRSSSGHPARGNCSSKTAGRNCSSMGLVTRGAGGCTRMETYEGSCHCQKVRFRVTADLSDVSECNCSICAKKGFLHLIVPPERFELLSGKDDLTTYEFNTKVAKHTFCRTCGIHAFYVPRSDPDKIDVNVRCLDAVDLAKIKPWLFDGKNWEATMAKRSAT
jgi:hypothetical protein